MTTDDEAEDGAPVAGQRRPNRDECLKAIEMVADGKSLRAACRTLGLHCPSTHTMIDEDAAKGGLREQYTRAKELRADFFQEEGLTVTKAAALGTTVNGKRVDPSGAKAYLDAIKWSAARMSPKTAPVQRVAHSFDSLTDDELEERIGGLTGEPTPDA